MRLLNLKYKIIVFLIFLLGISSCTTLKSIEQQKEIIFIPVRAVSSESVKPYKGWWVYGEDQHIFKDEETLEEYDLTFPNENMVELVELYLSVCEMEYFPMECEMTGILNGNILEVSNFEILYIQGCEE
tara:strand:- start:164 stop:550 length:387 start_codon:yes stop_codon:yes gene_type:complete